MGADEYMSKAAHDLRGPLSGIQASAQVLLRMLDRQGEIRGTEARSLLEGINRQTHRMSRAISQLQEVARLEAGVPLNRQPADLAGELRAAVEAAEEIQEGRSITLDVNGPVTALVDAFRVRQAVLEVLRNAVAASPAEEDVVVRCRQAGDAHIDIRVSDRGRGVDLPDRERLFERFYRGQEPGWEGLGLGLYITRLVVEAHGGQVGAEFPAEGGTCIHLRLPAL
jgi:signal transduction histidine kinase